MSVRTADLKPCAHSGASTPRGNGASHRPHALGPPSGAKTRWGEAVSASRIRPRPRRGHLSSTDAATTRRPLEWLRRSLRGSHGRMHWRQSLAANGQPVVAGLVLRCDAPRAPATRRRQSLQWRREALALTRDALTGTRQTRRAPQVRQQGHTKPQRPPSENQGRRSNIRRSKKYDPRFAPHFRPSLTHILWRRRW